MKTIIFFLAACAIVVGAVSCGNSGPVTVTETRTVETHTPKAAELPSGHPPTQTASPYTCDVPGGWEKLPSTPMRILNFRAGADVECYIAMLKGAAGGVDANINRWRDQMGQGALPPDELASLRKIDMLGKQAPMVEISGNYTDMSGKTVQGYMLMGAVAELEGNTLFAKMVGPADAVRTQTDAFVALCKSLRESAESPH